MCPPKLDILGGHLRDDRLHYLLILIFHALPKCWRYWTVLWWPFSKPLDFWACLSKRSNAKKKRKQEELCITYKKILLTFIIYLVFNGPLLAWKLALVRCGTNKEMTHQRRVSEQSKLVRAWLLASSFTATWWIVIRQWNTLRKRFWVLTTAVKPLTFCSQIQHSPTWWHSLFSTHVYLTIYQYQKRNWMLITLGIKVSVHTFLV